MATEAQFVQSAPEAAAAAASKCTSEEAKIFEQQPPATSTHPRFLSSWGPQLREGELDEAASAFLCWLARFPVERHHPRPPTGAISLKMSGEAVVCETTDKLTDVLQKLIVEGYLAMPVISPQGHKFEGYIDLLDVVWYVLWSFGVWPKSVASSGVAKSNPQHFNSFMALEKFRTATIADVLGRAGFGTRNAPHRVYPGFSLLHVVETMARLSVHRVAICGADHSVLGLITQSMVISLLDQNLAQIGDLATNHTVANILPGLRNELKLVNETDLALDAFKSLVTQNVGGLAVVNAAGEMKDTLSARDLRGLGAMADEWQKLWLTVAEYKTHCRSKYPAQTPTAPIFVQQTDTIATLIKRFEHGNIHRVFVCSVMANGAPVPTHCISQRDVLRYLLHLAGLKTTNLEMEDFERAAELL